MARGRKVEKLTEEVKTTIMTILDRSPKLSAKEVANILIQSKTTQLKKIRSDDRWSDLLKEAMVILPGVSLISAYMTKIRPKIKASPRDKQWSLGSCKHFGIPLVSIPVIIEVEKINKRHESQVIEIARRFGVDPSEQVRLLHLTIRQAQWLAILAPLALPVISSRFPDNIEQQYGKLNVLAHQYAFRDRIAEIKNEKYPDTSDLDITYLVDEDFSDATLSRAVINFTFTERMKEMAEVGEQELKEQGLSLSDTLLLFQWDQAGRPLEGEWIDAHPELLNLQKKIQEREA